MVDDQAGNPARAANVADVQPGRPDFAGNKILCLYAYKPPHYAVYRTQLRVMVHFADDPKEGDRQRARLAAITPLRGQVNALIDGWHSAGKDGEQPNGKEHPLRKRALRYDRRIADALVVALENDAATALALTAEIKNDIISERTSKARISYLSVALSLTGVFVVAALLLASDWAAGLFNFPPEVTAAWIAVAGGTVGAFFSIAIALKGRTVLIDLQNQDNFADASLRVLIGTMAGGMLYALMVSGLLSNVINSDQMVSKGGVMPSVLIFVIGFIAGFFERLVPDLLSQTKLGTEETTGGVTGRPNSSGPPIPPPPPSPPADPAAVVVVEEPDAADRSDLGSDAPADERRREAPQGTGSGG